MRRDAKILALLVVFVGTFLVTAVLSPRSANLDVVAYYRGVAFGRALLFTLLALGAIALGERLARRRRKIAGGDTSTDERAMVIDCGELFQDPHLHLLAWDRGDQEAQREALEFMADCVSDPRLAGHVMPLLHPLGREQDEYGCYDRQFMGGSAGPGLPALSPISVNSRLPCCELWLQVAHEAADVLWQRIVDLGGTGSWGDEWKAWKSHRQAVWQPLSPSFQCCGYAETACAPPHRRTPEAVQFLSKLTADNTARFLKVVWYQGTRVIVEELEARTRVLDLDSDQRGDSARLADLVELMLAEVCASEYGIHGIQGHLGAVDPCMLAVSHMTAFSINALTKIKQTRYCVEHYWGGPRATRPCCFQSRAEYLKFVRS